MRILYVITKSNWGGAQRHVYDLATRMKERGHEVFVALGGEGILKQRLEAAGVYTFSISGLGRDISVGKDAGSFKEIFSIIKNKKPDTLHLHSPKAAGLGALAGRMLRVKFIVTTVHGWTFNESRPFLERAAIAFFSWLTMMLSHKTVLIAEHEYAQARYFPFAKDKAVLVRPGLKAPTFISVDGAKQAIAAKLGMSYAEFSKKAVIGTIAELHPNKGLSYLIEAMESVALEHPEAVAVVIGDGQERQALEAQIAKKKLEQSVQLIGYLDNASEYLKAFTVFTLPSVKEGLPYAILEAGCASLPVAATTVGGIPEIIEDMRSGILVQPRNSRELGHALSFMIEHPEERRKYAAALKERVATMYSLDKMTERIEQLYATGN